MISIYNKIWSVFYHIWTDLILLFRLVLVVVWRFLEIHVNFMIIQWFLMYLADFRANFCVFFLRIFCFTGSNGYWRNPFYLSNILITIGCSFVGENHFFVWEIWQKRAKIGTIFLNFLQFFDFFRFFVSNSPAGSLFINSREAIAAIIGDIVVFYNSKKLNCIGALCFLRLEEEYWRSPFF